LLSPNRLNLGQTVLKLFDPSGTIKGNENDLNRVQTVLHGKGWSLMPGKLPQTAAVVPLELPLLAAKAL
jgi:hypothetical protein